MHIIYVKDGSIFTNRTSAQANQYLLWDFGLKNNSRTSGSSYCLRMVNGDGTPLANGYDYVPEITVSSQSQAPTIAFVSDTGQTVESPTIQMPSLNMTPSCQVSSVALGQADNLKLRLSQGSTSTDGFSVSIAPTTGQSSMWVYAPTPYPYDSIYYDFNDSAGSPAGCTAGSDGDPFAGQLTIDRDTSVLTPSTGCSLNGLSYNLGSSAFSSGTNDAITLIQGSSSVDTDCHWDLSQTVFSQTIPPNQPAGDYSLDLTVTVVAS